MTTTIANIIDRIDERVVVDSDTGCHEWVGWVGPYGYGYVWLDGKGHLAHRVAYALFVGDLDESKVIDHRCFNPVCVNPEHLEQVTQGENVRRWRDFEFAEGCKRGHSDWAKRPNGRRFCRTCHNDGQRRRHREKTS